MGLCDPKEVRKGQPWYKTVNDPLPKEANKPAANRKPTNDGIVVETVKKPS